MSNAPASETVWLLRAAIRQYGGSVRRALADAGYGDLPPRALWAIGAIHRNGGAAAPRALVEELGVTKQAVSQLVDLLVSLDYVRREGDPQDGRRHVITFTEHGKKAASLIGDACAVVDARLATRLGAHATLFSQLLHQLMGAEQACDAD